MEENMFDTFKTLLLDQKRQLIEQAKADLAEAKTTENKKAVEKAKNILDGLVDPITAYMPYDARKGIKVTKRHDFDNAADRASYRSEFIATIEYKSDAEIKAEMEAREQRIDRVGAGIGEKVLVLKEGSSARSLFRDDRAPVRTVIVGIVDEVEIEGRRTFFTTDSDS